MSKKTKIIIIVISIILLIAILCVAGYFVIRNMKINESVGTTWGDTYYAYLKEIKMSDNKTEYGLDQDTNNVKIDFIQAVEEEDPVMEITYNKDGAEYSNIYYINDSKAVEKTEPIAGTIEYLYNIEKSNYSWYVHTKEENVEKYQTVNKIINQDAENEEYSFEEKDLERNEANMNISEFDKIFITTDVEDSLKNEIDFSSDDLDFRDIVSNAVNGYKEDSELLTEELNQNITNRVEEIKNVEKELEEKEKLEKAKLTNENVQTRISNNLKWFKAGYLGSTYGWRGVYEYVDVSGKVKLPDVDEFMMVYEVKGATSIQGMKNELTKYMTSDVVNKLSQDPNFDAYLEEYKGKVYWITGGIGDGPIIDDTKAEVISSDGTTSKVVLEEYDGISNTKMEEITLTVKYENDQYMITDYDVVDKF